MARACLYVEKTAITTQEFVSRYKNVLTWQDMETALPLLG